MLEKYITSIPAYKNIASCIQTGMRDSLKKLPAGPSYNYSTCSEKKFTSTNPKNESQKTFNYKIKEFKSGSRYKVSARNPCSDKRSELAVINSYLKMRKCFNGEIDDTMMIPLLFHESAFQMNVFNNNGVGGIGQITKDHIITLNKQKDLWTSLAVKFSTAGEVTKRGQMTQSGFTAMECPYAIESSRFGEKNLSAQLEKIKQELQYSENELEDFTSRLCPPTQPEKAMFYSFLSMYDYAQKIDRMLQIESDSHRVKQIKKHLLSKSFRNELMSYMHNAGSSGTLYAFEKMVELAGEDLMRNKNPNAARDLFRHYIVQCRSADMCENKTKQKMALTPNFENFNAPRRAEEVFQYSDKVQEDGRNLERLSKGKCRL